MSKITQGLMALVALASLGVATATPASAAHFSAGPGPMWIRHGHMPFPMNRGMPMARSERLEPRDMGNRHVFVRHDDRFADRRFFVDRDFRHRHFRGGDFIFPFLAGALIGSTIYDDGPAYTYVAPAYGYGSAHVQWCYLHYRSYRAYDNTFQPNHGPRQQCYTPFG